MTRKIHISVLLVVLAFGAAALAGAAEGTFERTLDVTGPVNLDVKTGSGSISVTAGGDGTVSIHATITSRSLGAADKVRRLQENPPIEQDGNRVTIGRVQEHDLRQNVSISYEIVVPADTELVSKTGSGSQSIGNLRGPVHVKTGSGSIKVGSIDGDVVASAGSGSIRIEAASGSLQARAGSGSIVVTESAGDAELKTGSGTIQVNGMRGSLDAKTGSGGIEAAGDVAGDWTLRAASGGITVDVPDDRGFDLRAHTNSGGIHSDHPITVVGKISRKKMSGEVRGGGHLLDVKTSSGRIRIR